MGPAQSTRLPGPLAGVRRTWHTNGHTVRGYTVSLLDRRGACSRLQTGWKSLAVRVCAALCQNRIDLSVLPDLTGQDLKDLGIILGDGRKMLRAIAELDTMPEAVTLMPRAASTLSVATEQPVRVAEKSSERHHVTVMFCDLVDSTDVGAKLDVKGSVIWLTRASMPPRRQ